MFQLSSYFSFSAISAFQLLQIFNSANLASFSRFARFSFSAILIFQLFHFEFPANYHFQLLARFARFWVTISDCEVSMNAHIGHLLISQIVEA